MEGDGESRSGGATLEARDTEPDAPPMALARTGDAAVWRTTPTT